MITGILIVCFLYVCFWVWKLIEEDSRPPSAWSVLFYQRFHKQIGENEQSDEDDHQ
jgi:hypothetical protein